MLNHNRIIINTLAVYGQSVCTLALTLFSVRWVLHALGHTDYGLFGVVGSTIILMTMIANGLTVGVSRFYAYSIGEGSNKTLKEANDELLRWFNTALIVHLVLPLLLCIVGLPLAEYAIKHWLKIPLDRLQACIYVLRASAVVALATVMAVPFVSMLTAFQRIYIVAAGNLIKSLLAFIVAWCLQFTEGDRLVAYAVWMSISGVFVQLILVMVAAASFRFCRIRLSCFCDWSRVRRLFTYVGWKMYGMCCVALRQQGTPVVINLFHGPALNSAYSIANAVSTQTITLSSALTRAFQPAVIVAEGSGNRGEMISLSLSVCKFGSLLVMAFAVPAILEMHNLLSLWLVDPPQYTAEICQWMLGMLIVDRLTGGHMLAVNALGRIREYELVQGTILLSVVPLSALFYFMGASPDVVGVVLFVTMCIYSFLRVVFAKKLTDFPVLVWIKAAALPVSIALATVFATATITTLMMPESLLRLFITSIISLAALLLVSYLWVLSTVEKKYVINAIGSLRRKFNI